MQKWISPFFLVWSLVLEHGDAWSLTGAAPLNCRHVRVSQLLRAKVTHCCCCCLRCESQPLCTCACMAVCVCITGWLTVWSFLSPTDTPGTNQTQRLGEWRDVHATDKTKQSQQKAESLFASVLRSHRLSGESHCTWLENPKATEGWSQRENLTCLK